MSVWVRHEDRCEMQLNVSTTWDCKNHPSAALSVLIWDMTWWDRPRKTKSIIQQREFYFLNVPQGQYLLQFEFQFPSHLIDICGFYDYGPAAAKIALVP
jgi:hypothetical protein